MMKIFNSPFPANAQQRYDELFEKLQDEQITKAEYKELMQLVEQAEQHNLEWLEALVKLADLRGVSIQEIKNQLNKNSPLT